MEVDTAVTPSLMSDIFLSLSNMVCSHASWVLVLRLVEVDLPDLGIIPLLISHGQWTKQRIEVDTCYHYCSKVVPAFDWLILRTC